MLHDIWIGVMAILAFRAIESLMLALKLRKR